MSGLKVPVYEQQVGFQAPQVGTPEVPRAPAEAFGTQIGTATEQLGAHLAAAGEVLGKHIIQQKIAEDERQVLAKDTAFRSDLQNRLYNQETDPNTGTPKGFLNRQMTQAQGATPEFDQTFASIRKQYLDSLQTDYQKEALGKLIDSQFETARSSVIRHEAEQGRAAYNATLDANLKQRVMDAGAITDPEEMGLAIDQATSIAGAGLSRAGFAPGDIAVRKQQLAADMVRQPFETLLSQDYRQAKSLLDGVRDKIPASAAASMDRALEGKNIDDTQRAAWDSVSTLKLADGTPDLAKMEATVRSMNLPQDKTEKVWSYVRARAGELDQQQKQQDAATIYALSNEAYAMKQKGQTLDDALKTLVPKYGGDLVTSADHAETVKKIFTTKTITDPQTYLTLWEGSKDGTLGKAEINQAFQDGKLSTSDFVELNKTKFEALHKDDTFLQKEMFDHIKDFAKVEIGSNPKKLNEYLYTVLSQSRGKTPEEMWKMANDLAKGDPKTGVWGFFQDGQWQTDLKNKDAQSTVWGKLHEDIGQNQVKAIGQGALYSGKDKWGASDVQDFAQALGGYDKIKKGTPENEAIQSLILHRKVVTPDSVKKVLSVHPSGVWR